MTDYFATQRATDPKFGGLLKKPSASKESRPATLEDARASAIDLIDKNIAYHLDNTQEEPNMLVSELSWGAYSVGAKYSNTWLPQWMDTQGDGVLRTYATCSEESVVDTLNIMKQMISDGMADGKLQDIMKKNLELRRKQRMVS